MPHLHKNDKNQPQSKAAANSPNFQQKGVTSFMPPQFKATADSVSQMKENVEEKVEALQKKENNSNFAGGDAPITPPNSNIKNNVYRSEPKQFKAYQPSVQKKTVKQFKQHKPFQLKKSPADPKSQNGLPQEVQAKMENSLGHDFSNVNIHKNSRNATDAGALAYAQGNDVHFAPGQFKPDTTSGQELIGHELAHVAQQREGRVKPTKMLGKGMPVNDDPGLEKEADDMGRKAAQGKFSKEQDKSKSIAVSNPSVQRLVAYPWHGMVSARWQAALRNTAADGPGNFVMNLRRTTRVMVISETDGWLQVSTTVDGSVQTGFVHNSLVSPIGASTEAVENEDSRRETTAFGDYNVYPNSASRRGLEVNELYEAEFQKLKTAWDRVNDNSGGIVINGTPADVADMRSIIGREMSRSLTFRNLIIEITEDSSNPVTVNAGRDNAYFIDSFATNNSDLNDNEMLDETPRTNYEWGITQGEITTHWLAERRNEVINNLGVPLTTQHTEPLASGGIQEQFRADIGSEGRIVTQSGVRPTPQLLDGEFTDDSGNIQRFRTDPSGGDLVTYEIEYAPASPTTAAPGETRYNNIITNLTSTSGDEEAIRLVFNSQTGNTFQEEQDVNTTNAMNLSNRLGSLVPAGSSINIEIYRDRGLLSLEALIGILTWAHPFNADSLSITVDGVDYSLNVSLVMDP